MTVPASSANLDPITDPGGPGLAGSFDVFFSYSTRDHAAVERVARALTDCGLRVFLDRWYLTPGQPWPQLLEETLAACNAVAVFIGADGLGPWQQRERDLALDRKAREPDFPVIPVLLTRADPALGFLKLHAWVDLSVGAADPEALAILAGAVRGEPPGPLAQQRSDAARAAVCPYRGLRPFREEDEPFFFGRSSFAETLTATVLRQPFVAVIGASGSGKSSVVRAGLIPRLRRGAGDRVWDALTLVPTDRPLTSLAAALLPALESDLSEVDRLAEVGKLATHLADGTVGLRDVAARVLAKQPGTDRLLLFIDQWEELYTLCADDAVRRAFVGHLLAAAVDQVCVVSTIRGDFMGRALDNRDLADRLQDAVVSIGPMTRDELAETIVRPAEKTGLAWEPGLPETILDDVGDEPGGLPLLEFLLEGLWAERRGNVLTHEAYLRLGRVAGAIAYRAEDVFEHKLTDAERQAAQRLLIRMVRPGEGAEDTRRRTALPHADPVAEATIRKLTSERLIVTERDGGTGEMTVEVAHEALIRGWQRLRAWIDHDREFLRTRERIAAQAQLWQEEARSADRLLPPGRPLAEGEDVLANRRGDLERLVISYIESSAAAQRVRQEAERAADRRRLRYARSVAAVMSLLAIAFAGLAYLVNAQRNAALRNESRLLAALAEKELEHGSPSIAVRVALSALPQNWTTPDRLVVPEAELALYVALDRLWGTSASKTTVLRGHEDRVTSVMFSSDAHTLLTVSSDNTARIWDMSSKNTTQVLGDSEGGGLRFAAIDGKSIVTVSADGTFGWWYGNGGDQISHSLTYKGQQVPVSCAVLHLDMKNILAISGETIPPRKAWQKAVTIACDQTNATFAAFSADGHTGVISLDKTIQLWDVESNREIDVLRGHEGLVISAAFSPDGRTLVTTSTDKTARLWDVATGKEILALRGHAEEVDVAAFGPDARTVVTVSADKSARLWDVASGVQIAIFRGLESNALAAAFSPDGRVVAIGLADGTVQIWAVLPRRQALTELACAQVHGLPLSERDKDRFGIHDEWCTPEVSAALRAKLGLDKPDAAPRPVATW